VSECDREASIMRRPWPTGGAVVPRKKISDDRMQQSATATCVSPAGVT
jgi:hypothetical protein